MIFRRKDEQAGSFRVNLLDKILLGIYRISLVDNHLAVEPAQYSLP